jgi:hypothetical protein
MTLEASTLARLAVCVERCTVIPRSRIRIARTDFAHAAAKPALQEIA